MAGRLGAGADIVMSESILSSIISAMENLLLEEPKVHVLLGGRKEEDTKGEYLYIFGIVDVDPIGMSVASSEGGIVPDDDDLALFREKVGEGMLMKVDVFAKQLSFYKVKEKAEPATIVLME